MSIRAKLILMLAIPLAALALVGALGFRSQSSTSRTASAALESDMVVQTINRAIKALGAERLTLVLGTGIAELAELRQETTETLNAAGRAAEDAGQFPMVEATIREAGAVLASNRYTEDSLGFVLALNDSTRDLRNLRDDIDVA